MLCLSYSFSREVPPAVLRGRVREYTSKKRLDKKAIMPYCIVKHCRNSSGNIKTDSGISFHRFPKDKILRSKWTKAIIKNREDETWVPSPYSVVCSAHFENKDIYFAKSHLRNRLHKHAVPTKNLIFRPKISTESDWSIGFKDSLSETSLDLDIKPTQLLFSTVVMPGKLDSDKKKIKSLQQKVRRLTKSLSSLKAKVKGLTNIHIHKQQDNSIVPFELFHNLYVRPRRKGVRTFSAATKKFSLILDSYSPQAYEYVRKTFNKCLPHRKTLAKYIRRNKLAPGFTEELLPTQQDDTTETTVNITSHLELCWKE